MMKLTDFLWAFDRRREMTRLETIEKQVRLRRGVVVFCRDFLNAVTHEYFGNHRQKSTKQRRVLWKSACAT